MAIWQFTVTDKDVSYGVRNRRLLTAKGCNEPFKERYWCPRSLSDFHVLSLYQLAAHSLLTG